MPQPDTMDVFRRALDEGLITEKEKDLCNFVLSSYGSSKFSTKQLERDFGNAANNIMQSFNSQLS